MITRYNTRKTDTKETGFSLVEMLLVIAILGVLTTIALPGLVGNHLSRSLQTEATEIKTALEEARWMAINKRQRAALLVAGSPNTALEGQLGHPVSNTHYTIAIYDKSKNSWVETSPWRELPNGLEFYPGSITPPTTVTGNSSNALNDTMQNTTLYRSANATTSIRVNIATIQFNPDGSAISYNDALGTEVDNALLSFGSPAGKRTLIIDTVTGTSAEDTSS